MPVFLWVGLDLVFLVGRAASGGVLGGVCELSMILGSLSANGWGCVPGASCLAWAIQHWILLAIGWTWLFMLRWRSLGELLPTDIMWGQEVSGVPVF